MPTIEFIADDGSIAQREALSRDAALIPEGEELDTFQPTLVRRLEYDHKGQTSSITSVCGETEERRSGDNLPDITIEGIILEDEIQQAKDLKIGERIVLVSDVHQGPVFVKSLSIEQSTDVIHYIPDKSDEKELAFSFQLQLGQEGGGPA